MTLNSGGSTIMFGFLSSRLLSIAASIVPLSVAMSMDNSTPYTDWRVNVGIATPVTKMDIKKIRSDTGTTSNQDLTAGYRASPHVGIQMIRGSVGDEGVGMFWGVEAAYDQHNGRTKEVGGQPTSFGTEGDLTIFAYTGTLTCGGVFQADLRDMGVRADTFRVEVGPTLGAGLATSRVGTNKSGSSALWSVGMVMNFITTLEDGMTIGLGGGYEYSISQPKWSNTDASTVVARGPIARLGIGYRW